MILTKANNMPLINTISVLGTAFLSLGFRYLINKINNIKSKQIHFIMFIYITNIFNLLIHLIITENEAQFNDLIIPFLIIFPLLMIIFSIIHIKNINDNVYHKQLLNNSINNIDGLCLVTIDLNYNFIIFNDNFIKKSKIYLNHDVKKVITT